MSEFLAATSNTLRTAETVAHDTIVVARLVSAAPFGNSVCARALQVGVEAIIPMDAHSGRDVGARAQAHLYLPAIFPDFYAKPVFGD
jgi:thiazole synthase ThiGH ThiG subunit